MERGMPTEYFITGIALETLIWFQFTFKTLLFLLSQSNNSQI
jgi:hypothetical protein